MGLNYSLVAIIPRRESVNLLHNLANILDETSAHRLSDILWAPETEAVNVTVNCSHEVDARGINDFYLTEIESQNAYCFGLCIQLETEMQKFIRPYECDCFDRAGSFGCMWTSVYAGAHYLMLQMTAAASDMSRVLLNSSSIRVLWTGFAKQINALVAYIDIEDDRAIPIYPELEELILPDLEFIAFEDSIGISADLLMQQLIELNPLLKC